jgi:mRNA interferase RelE/StbE
MKYTLRLKPIAKRQLRKLDPAIIVRITKKLYQLQNNPRPPGVKRLVDEEDGHRIRVGRWRVLYMVNDDLKEIEVYRIKSRDQAYR